MSVVVDDVRFPNEAQVIHEMGGMVVRIVRGSSKVTHNASPSSHESEFQAFDVAQAGALLDTIHTMGAELRVAVRDEGRIKFCVDAELDEAAERRPPAGNRRSNTMNPTDDLTRALSAWLTSVAFQLDDERRRLLYACLDADQHDVYIAVHLREGSVVLDGVNLANNTRCELWREDVQPLTPDSGFAMPDTSTKQ